MHGKVSRHVEDVNSPSWIRFASQLAALLTGQYDTRATQQSPMVEAKMFKSQGPCGCFHDHRGFVRLQSAYVCGLCLRSRSGSVTWFAGGECEQILGGVEQYGGLDGGQ
ncbi:hypothetical protein SRHO_G00085470 [Serrasalmus rhombeus]